MQEGCIHGRFQPFHIEHLDYALAAKARCGFLWIGITRYDESDVVLDSSPCHRNLTQSNPLTYYERVCLITAALVEAGVSPGEFGFLPFPIDRPHTLGNFVPTTVPCYTTSNDDWNDAKARVLRSCGYIVVTLWRRPKTISGGEVRHFIAMNDPRWRRLVPLATIDLIEAWRVRERLATESLGWNSS